MASLLAFGYDDETTAHAAAEEAHRLADELRIDPDAVAVIVRGGDGAYTVTTNHGEAGATCGMFWSPLFRALFFDAEPSGLDPAFDRRVRDMLKPGTSALFIIVERVGPETAVEGLRQYGGTIADSSLSDRPDLVGADFIPSG
jgi:uncharacterized membrane protein